VNPVSVSRTLLRRVAPWAAVGLLAGCATNVPPRESAKPGPPATAAEPARTETAPGKARPSPPPTVQRRKALPVRPITLAADCSFRDPNGYRGAMKLDVAKSEVRRFEADVDVPNRGACRFSLKDFRQTGTMPSVILSASGSRCVVRMWEQGHRVSVAFDDCQNMCTGSAWTYLWPILADSRTGGCG
jgi:hypothetical protein